MPGDMTLVKPSFYTALNRTHPLAKGLVGCWLLNENNGTIINDLAGTNDGELINNAAWAITQKGPGLEFPTDGGSDRVDIGSINSSDPISGVPTGKISIVTRFY